MAELDRLGFSKDRAQQAQRIGTLPEKEKKAASADAEKQDILPTITMPSGGAIKKNQRASGGVGSAALRPWRTSTTPPIGTPV
jgi:hypothetical protein